MPGGGGARARGGRGGGGGGGGAAGGNPNAAHAARQFFLSLFGDAAQAARPHGRAGAGGGGGGGGGPRRGGGGTVRTREGEWGCACGYANRAFRESCHSCGRARPAAEGGGKGQGTKAATRANGDVVGAGGKGKGPFGEARRWGSGGPVGAGGSRPLLGRYGGSGKAGPGPEPLADAKGKSAGVARGAPAGKASSELGKGPARGANGKGGEQWGPRPGNEEATAAGAHAAAARPMGAWTRPPRTVDGDGFTLVQPRRTWSPSEPSGQQHGGVKPAEGSAPRAAVGPRWSDEDSDDEMYAAEDVEEDDREHEEEGEGGADPRALRSRFESLARAVREMERRGRTDPGDPALLALRTARDDAERTWRETKAPAPLPVRMGRVQAKLDRAQAALSRARLAIDDFDNWVEERRAELVQQKDEAERWLRWREQQMDSLHGEAGEKAAGRPTAPSGTNGAAIAGRINDEWLPALHAILEHVQGNPEIEERVADLAEGLQCAGRELDNARPNVAECYDIGGDDGWRWQRDDCDGYHDGTDGGGDELGGGEPRCAPRGAAAAWRSEGPGRWAKTRQDQGTGPTPAMGPRCDQEADGARGTAAAAAPATPAQGDANPSSAGTGNKRGAEGDADDKGASRQKTDADAREEADRQKAAELLQRQQQAIAAQQASHDAGAGGFGSESAQAVAAQQFIEDVCKAVERARAKGVEPKADGRELVELTPMELRRWVDINLDGADYKR